MGGPLAVTGGTFANTRGPRMSGGPLADTGGNFSPECFSKGAVFSPCVLKSPIMVDGRAQFLIFGHLCVRWYSCLLVSSEIKVDL